MTSGLRIRRIRVSVICNKCSQETEWRWGKASGYCNNCDSYLRLKDVKLASGEILKILG